MSVVVRGYADDSVPVIGWDNPLKGATVTSSSTFEPGFPAASIVTYPTWEGAKPTTTVGFVLFFDLGEVYDIDYVALSGVLSGEGETGPLISLASSTDGVTYTTFENNVAVTKVTMLLFDKISTRYLSIFFNPLILFVGNIMAGEALRLERGLYVGHSPATLNRITEVTGATSESGQYLGRVIRSAGVRTSVDLQNVDPEFARDELDPFFEAARERPFYFAWRPSTYEDEVIYGWMDGDPQVTNQRANGMMQASFSIRGRAV